MMAQSQKTKLTRVRLVVPVLQADTVEIAGDFAGWDKRISLKPIENGLWVGELELPAGRYRYVIVIDGKKMLPDPAAKQIVADGFGGKNSILDISKS